MGERVSGPATVGSPGKRFCQQQKDLALPLALAFTVCARRVRFPCSPRANI